VWLHCYLKHDGGEYGYEFTRSYECNIQAKVLG